MEAEINNYIIHNYIINNVILKIIRILWIITKARVRP